MTAFCVLRRISPPRAPNSSVMASSTSLDHAPRTSVMMLYCRMSYPGNCCLKSQRRGHTWWPSLLSFLSHPLCLPHLLNYCKDWNIPICLRLGWLVGGFGNDRRIRRWHCVRELKLSKHLPEQYFEGRIMTREVLILCKRRATRQRVRDDLAILPQNLHRVSSGWCVRVLHAW